MSSWSDGAWTSSQSGIHCCNGTEHHREGEVIRLSPDDGLPYCREHFPRRARVLLFKPDGKYYTEEHWLIPANAIVPYEMWRSSDFRRISGGAVLVDTQEPWGYPHLFPATARADG